MLDDAAVGGTRQNAVWRDAAALVAADRVLAWRTAIRFPASAGTLAVALDRPPQGYNGKAVARQCQGRKDGLGHDTTSERNFIVQISASRRYHRLAGAGCSRVGIAVVGRKRPCIQHPLRTFGAAIGCPCLPLCRQ